MISQHNEHTLDAQSEIIDKNDDTIAEQTETITEQAETITVQAETISQNEQTIMAQSQKVKTLSAEISELSKTYETTEEQVKEKTAELLEVTETWPAQLEATFLDAQDRLENELIPPVTPTDRYERVQKSQGFGKPKKTFVMVPEKEYEVLDRRNSLRPEHVKNIISETIRPISAAIKNLPGMQSMIAALREMQEKVDVLTKKLKKAMSEKEALAKEVAQLREENHAFKQQTAIADKVLFGKLHLSKEAVEKMKAEATSEILENKSRIQDVRPVSIDDEVLGR